MLFVITYCWRLGRNRKMEMSLGFDRREKRRNGFCWALALAWDAECITFISSILYSSEKLSTNIFEGYHLSRIHRKCIHQSGQTIATHRHQVHARSRLSCDASTHLAPFGRGWTEKSCHWNEWSYQLDDNSRAVVSTEEKPSYIERNSFHCEREISWPNGGTVIGCDANLFFGISR